MKLTFGILLTVCLKTSLSAEFEPLNTSIFFSDDLVDSFQYEEFDLIIALVDFYKNSCGNDSQICRNFIEEFEARAFIEGLTEELKQAAIDLLKKASQTELRGLGQDDVHIPLWGIWDYGCWCNLKENYMIGNGHPVNAFDTVCKKMKLCLKCAEMDYSTDKCDPPNQSYNANFNWFNSDTSLLGDCGFQNGNSPCAAAV